MAGWTTPDNENTFWKGTINSNFIGTTIVPTDDTHLVNKEYVDDLAGRSSIDLFITKDASDIGGYFNLDADINITAEQSITDSVPANSILLLGSFASQLDEQEIDLIELLESGIYEMHIHASGQVNTGLHVFYEFYKRDSGGIETLLGISHNSHLLTTVDSNFNIHASVVNETIWTPGDRVVVKVYGRNDNNAARNITITMEGVTAARVVFPGVITPNEFLTLIGENQDNIAQISGALNIASSALTSQIAIVSGALNVASGALTEDIANVSGALNIASAALHVHLGDTSPHSGAVHFSGDAQSGACVSIWFGTSATPPTASETPLGTIYMKYTV